MNDDSLRYLIGVTMIPGIGSITARKILAVTGSAETVFSEPKMLLKIPSIGKKIASAVTSSGDILHQADKEIEFLRKNNFQVYTCYDKEYPWRLKECNDAPLVLYVKGKVNLNAAKMLAVVGTRHATAYGCESTEKIIRDLASGSAGDLVIVSGLAYGIDVTAHQTALACDVPTIAVVAHGLDTLYPASHRHIARKIAGQGALVTEFPTGTQPDKALFVRRNRIIAGLSDAVLITESGEKGGALITAEYALSYNREVMSLPGKTTDTYSRGCNMLIKSHKAHLVENAADIRNLMNWPEDQNKTTAVQQSLFSVLSPEEEKLFECIRQQPGIYIDELCFHTQMTASRVSSLLLTMELAGLVKCLPGKKYMIL